MLVQLGFKAEDIIAEGRVTNDDINQINSWVREQIIIPILTEEEIVNFLLSNDNDQERTKNTIKAYFKLRNESPEIFNYQLMENGSSDLVQTIGYFSIAPKRTADNCAVMHTQLYNTRYQSFNLALFSKYMFMTLEAAIYSSPPSGLIVVIDMVGVGLMHLTKLRPSVFGVTFRYLQEALPVKLKNIHIINTPYFMNKVLAIMKPFMSDHVRELMIIHKRECNMDEFYEKCVAKQLLPKDIGGELPCMKDLTEQLIKKFKDMKPYFIAKDNQKAALK